MATQAEQLILRGLHLLMRTTFMPNDEVRAAKQLVGIQQDVGPWFSDYVTEIAKPASDEPTLKPDPAFRGGL